MPRSPRFLSLIGMTVVMACVLTSSRVWSADGSLTIYTPHGPDVTAPIFELFKTFHPNIKIDVVTGGTGEVLERLRAEQANPAADIMWGGPTQTFEGAAELFDVHQAAHSNEMIVSDPANRWHAFSVLAHPLLINTKKVSPEQEPKTVGELADPKWKSMGGIALADPAKSGSGYTIISAIAATLGWPYLEKLLPTLRVAPGSSAMVNAVRDGEVALAWTWEDQGVKWMAEGLSVKMIYPSDVVPILVDATALIKGAPNQNNGRLFLDFLGTPEVHKIVVEQVKRRSARKDMASPQDLPPLTGLKLAEAVEPRDVVVTRFAKIVGQ
jgi:iron(III) transport system substrate-binding protein